MNIEIIFHLNSLFLNNKPHIHQLSNIKKKLFLLKKYLQFLKKHIDSGLKNQAKF
tara:strand:- start:67 stop:231 length:165 start_codon:yes stop_codon:yes gene_type:complete